MSERTSLPWQSQHEFDDEGLLTIVGNVDSVDGDYGVPRVVCTKVCEMNNEIPEWGANRRFLLKAVNNHDRLVEMVRDLSKRGHLPGELDALHMQARALLDELK